MLNKIASLHARVSIFGVFLSSLFAAPTFAGVLVVDASGGGDYTQIQPAVDAAFDGDTILVRTGDYAWFSVSDKALAIVGDTGSVVHVTGGVRIRNLSAGKTFVLEHVSSSGVLGGDGTTPYGIFLSLDAGHVRIEACQFDGAAHASSNNAPGYAAIRVESCADVALTNTTGTGGSGAVGSAPNGSGLGGAGATAQASTLTLYDCTLHGGDGDSADPDVLGHDGGSGGHGCLASSSVVFAAGSRFFGGNGGGGGASPFGMAPTFGGEGGDGIQLTSASLARLLDDVAQAGTAGQPGHGDGAFPGDDGQSLDAVFGSSFVQLIGPSKHMVSPTPVRENTAFSLSFTGVPGEQVALVVANEADHVLKLQWKGVMLIHQLHPMLSIPVGTIPPSGTLTVAWDAPDLGGLPARLVHMQPVFVDAQGHRTIGNPSCMIILNHIY